MQHSSETNVPCYLLILTSEFEHGHACLLPLRRLESPSRENLDFHFHARRQSVGGKDRPLYWCPPGDQMKASASPHSSACASMKGQSRGSPQLVALKTDEAMVLGLGPPGSPAGTSLLGWYIRSRSHMTCHCREQWDGGECFSLLHK